MGYLFRTGLVAIILCFTCLVIVVAFLQRREMLAGGIFVAAVLVSLLTPTIIPRTVRMFLWLIAIVWAATELAPEIGFQSPNPVITGLLALPALIAAGFVVRKRAQATPDKLPMLAFIVCLSEIAYLLPYLLATPVERRPPFAGIGCMSIGCGSALSGTDSTSYVYAIGNHFAGSLSVVLVVATGIFGNWLLNRALEQKRKNSAS